MEWSSFVLGLVSGASIVITVMMLMRWLMVDAYTRGLMWTSKMPQTKIVKVPRTKIVNNRFRRF